jgi:hypothetical protein
MSLLKVVVAALPTRVEWEGKRERRKGVGWARPRAPGRPGVAGFADPGPTTGIVPIGWAGLLARPNASPRDTARMLSSNSMDYYIIAKNAVFLFVPIDGIWYTGFH